MVVFLFLFLFQFIFLSTSTLAESDTLTSSSKEKYPKVIVKGGIVMSAGLRKSHKAANAQPHSNATGHETERTRHARNMYRQLPFPVDEYPAIFASNCNSYNELLRSPSQSARVERGYSLSHFQIWSDFMFFDPGVIRKSIRQPNIDVAAYFGPIGNFNHIYPVDYQYKRGQYYRDEKLLSEDDILVVFEDDAVISVTNITAVLDLEFRHMSHDIVYLGWCRDEVHPYCSHAYAATRRGVRKLMKNIDLCSLFPFDKQLRSLCSDEVISCRIHLPLNPKLVIMAPLDKQRASGIFKQYNFERESNHM